MSIDYQRFMCWPGLDGCRRCPPLGIILVVLFSLQLLANVGLVAYTSQQAGGGEHLAYVVADAGGRPATVVDHRRVCASPWHYNAPHWIGFLWGLSLLVVLGASLGARKQAEATLRAANTELQRLAAVDGLTQVANRRAFDERLAGEWRRLQRVGRPLSLLLFDVDHFKRYNDHYGHPQGDRCLIRIANAARQVLQRPADLLARYGGEEFAVILPDTDETGACAVAGQIQEAVRVLNIPHRVSPGSERISISIGVASLVPDPGALPARLIEQADQALYLAKHEGRDRYRVFR